MEDEKLEQMLADAFSDEAESAAEEQQPADDNGTQAENAKQEEAKKEPMPPEERARQAHGRRIREAEQRAYQAGLERASESIKRAGIVNSETGKPITTLSELDEFIRTQSDERLENGNANAEDVRRLIREEINRTQAPQTAQPSPEEKKMVDQQLAQIRQMDPAMTDLDAILASEAGEQFRHYVGMGLDFIEAYTLAAKDRLAGISANRAGAKGSGKDHLQSLSSRGQGALDVPPDEMALFRELNPGASDAEIRAFYNTDKKRFG